MKWFIGIVIALIVIVGGWYYYSSSQTATVSAPQATETRTKATEYSNTAANTPPASGGTAQVPASTGTTVTYTASGFSPKTVTVKKGESVTFVDQSGTGMWVASAMHPDHTAYSGTTRQEHCPDTAGVAFDQCAVGGTYTFTFQKTGTWKYHNHVNASAFGAVVVQ